MDKILLKNNVPQAISPQAQGSLHSFLPSAGGLEITPSHFISLPVPDRDKKTCRQKNFSTTTLKTWEREGGWSVIYGPLFIFCARQHQCKREHYKSIQHNTYIHTYIFIHTHKIQQENFSCSSLNTSFRRP